MIYISQGSVSTQLRCGGILSNHSIYGTQIVRVKKLKIGQQRRRYRQTYCFGVTLYTPLHFNWSANKG